MKRFLPIAVLFLLSSSTQFLHAQIGVYFGGGYTGNFGLYDSLNFIVDRYNDTRIYLDETMKPFEYYQGPTGSAGLYLGPLLVQANYSMRVQKRYAVGTDITNTEVRREVRMRMNSFGAGLGINLPLSFMRFSPGAALNFGNLNYETRVAPSSDIKDELWSEVLSESNKSVEIFAQIVPGDPGGVGLRLVLMPYYNIALRNKIDISDLNKAINPVTAPLDPSPININPNYFGFRVMVVLYFGT
jgi:hypothetical protein